MDDRRRSPRHALQEGELLDLPAALEVQVVDLSLAGALLLTNQPVAVGTRAHLRLHVDGHPISAEVEVRRVTAAEAGGHHLGVEIVEMSGEVRDAITRMMPL
jgi:hypothetical protein